MVSLPCSSPQLAETEGGAGVEYRRAGKGGETETEIEKHREKEREDRWKGNK